MLDLKKEFKYSRESLPFLLRDILEKVYSEELELAKKEAEQLVKRYSPMNKKIDDIRVGFNITIIFNKKQ